jgi:hypothetical protein
VLGEVLAGRRVDLDGATGLMWSVVPITERAAPGTLDISDCLGSMAFRQ